MIRNLVGAGAVRATAQVLVIGGGTAGLAIAARLAEQQVDIVCLESGDRTQSADEHPLNAVVHARATYGGAAHGRFRCLGGTSTRWGGALIPFQEADLRDHDWPIPYKDILAYRPAVERFFDLPDGSYESPDQVTGPDFVARLAKWPPFARRNVANLLAPALEGATGPAVWFNATATRFDVRDGVLVGVRAQAPDGSVIDVAAQQVIIAAGAIESTRLLLLLDQQNGGDFLAVDDQIGRHFHDHLSVVVADLAVRDRKALNKLVGFRFERGGAMRNLRFELAPDTPLRARIVPCFAHIGFEDRAGGGFDALRTLFRFIQQRQRPPLATLYRLAIAAPWLMRATWWRYVSKRLLYPGAARLQIHMVIEQAGVATNRIVLTAERRDPYGNPLAEIDWAPGRDDAVHLTCAVDAFEAAWHEAGLEALATIVRRPPGEAEAELATGAGIYHPGGSTRMAHDAASGVVDRDLALFRIPNVSVVATSVLPNGGGSNPTMMLMMLAFRCADRIAELIRGANTP